MADDELSASQKLDQRIEELGDWRGERLRQVRAVIRRALPDVVEEWKWAKPTSPGVPVWSSGGNLCTGEVYTSAVKLTFLKGASLPDPKGLFTSSLEGKVRRGLDLTEGSPLDEEGLADLVRAAAALNAQGKRKG